MKILFFTGLMFLASCQYKEKKNPVPILKAQPQSKLEILEDFDVIDVFEGEIVNNDTFAITVLPGDKIFTTVEGVRETPIFSELYKKESWSYWLRPLRCEGHGFCSQEYSSVQGKCSATFRDYEGTKQDTIVWNKDAKELDIRYRIGTKEYSLGTRTNSDNVSTFVIDITEEMTAESNELYFVIKKPPTRPVKVGFVDYAKGCQGGSGFTTGHNTNFEMMPGEHRDHFLVSSFLRRTQENTQ